MFLFKESRATCHGYVEEKHQWVWQTVTTEFLLNSYYRNMSALAQKIYVITMKQSNERRKALLESLKDHAKNVVFISKAPWYPMFRGKLTKGEFNLYRKFLAIFQMISRHDHHTLVLEDDAIALPGWHEAIVDGLETLDNPDFLFLSNNQYSHPKERVSDLWFSCKWSRTCCATVFSPRACELLLKHPLVARQAIDWAITSEIQKGGLSSFWHQIGVFDHGSSSGIYRSTLRKGK